MPLRLTAKDLACTRGGAPVFSGVTFRLEAGGLLTLRGANGSGKSSLLRLLGGLMKPAAGTVALDLGTGPLPPEEIARRSHLIGHRGGLTDAMSAYENLRFQTALLGADVSRVPLALERAGLAALSAQRAGALSAGQRRRLSLARLITVNRPVWLLDEPMEALDAAGGQLVEGLIEEHRAGGGITVVATHGRLDARPGVTLTLIPAASERAA